MVAKSGGANIGKKQVVQDFRKQNAASQNNKYTQKIVDPFDKIVLFTWMDMSICLPIHLYCNCRERD